MPKPSLQKNSSGTIQPIGWKIRRFNTFPKGTCITLKMNVRARLEFKLANYYVAVLHFSLYATGTFPSSNW